MVSRRLLTLAVRRLAAALLAGAALAPVTAMAHESDERPSAFETLSNEGWRLVPLSQMLEHSQRERQASRGMPRILPLAMMPMQRSALWLGVSGGRGEAGRTSGVRLELRWSIPLDRLSGRGEAPALELR